MPFFARVFYAWVVYFRVIFDGSFAARVRELSTPALATLPAAPSEPPLAPAAAPPAPTPAPAPTRPYEESALHLLAALQREGRFLDFVGQSIDGLSDADIGAASRVVHAGCKKAVRSAVTIAPIRAENEGDRVEIAPADAANVTFLGNGADDQLRAGRLVHKGWRATATSLPESAPGHDATILHPAEVERS
jgi:hypothetical protein